MTFKYTVQFFALLIICFVLPEFSTAQTYVPVSVTGFNHDLIANGAGGVNHAAASTTITFDGENEGGDNVMYSTDFRGNNNPNTAPPFGLPPDGVVTSVNLPGAIYQLAPYDQNNALVLKANGSSGTLILGTPGVFSSIAFLGASAEGASGFNVTLNFSDGSSITSSFIVPDWYNGPNFALKGIGRVTRSMIGTQLPDQFTGDADNPRLYDNQIILDSPNSNKILTSITFEKTTVEGSTAILAINGVTAINAPDAPVANAATDISSNSFTANWSASAGATGYFIDVSTSPDFITLLPSYNNLDVGNTVSSPISGLASGQTHYYRIRAKNNSGISPSSSTIVVNLVTCPPGNISLPTQNDVNQFLLNYPNCKVISGNLYIGVQNGLCDIADLSPLSNLEMVEGYLVVYSTSLMTLNGLNNLTSIGQDIDIRNNPVLSDITALQQTTFAPFGGFGLTIVNNPVLSICNLANFCDYLSNPASTHPRLISGNTGDCATEQAVSDACNPVNVPDGEYCSNAIGINNLFGHPVDEPQNSGTYDTEGFNALNDPSFGQECLGDNYTIWFKFTGDGNRYAVRSRDCSAKIYTNPNGAMYSGECADLNAIDCHRDISSSDENPDANFRIEVQTVAGKEYFLMVEVQSTDDFEEYFEYGQFCLEVTRLDPECLVTIPDINFKAYLIENAEINTNVDGEIQCEEAENFFGAIDCSGLGILDLTGIETFINLTQLNCSDNELTALNVLNNTSLWLLHCGGNNLTAIDFSEILWLEELVVSGNKITSLDLSGNVKISYFLANNNNLSRLDLANGNNSFFNTIHVQNNPALTCIKVDDADYSNTNWTGTNFLFDDQHTFNESCNPCEEIGKEVDATFLVGSSGCVGDSIHFIDYTIVDFEAEQIQFSWDFGDGNTSLQRDPVHIYADQGDHLVSLTVDIPGCESILMNKSIRILNCLKNNGSQQGYSRVMPNPTTGAFRLESRLPLTGDVSVKIYNTEGRQVYARQYRNTDHVSDDILFGKPGTYIAEIRHISGVDKVRIIIIR